MFVKESQTKELNINIKYKKFIDVMHEHGPDKAFQILDTLYETNTQQQSLFSY